MSFEIIKSHLKTYWKQYIIASLTLFALSMTLSSYFLFTYVRQLQNEITIAQTVLLAKESTIQEFDTKLGISDSNLRKQKELNEKYSAEIQRFKNELQEKSKELSLKDFELKSRERTIASLRGQIIDGISVITVDGEPAKDDALSSVGVVSYSWEDHLARFKLTDPDISKPGNEKFTYKQQFRITGLVLSDASGAVQVNKVSMEEVVAVDRNGVLTYEKVDGGDAILIESEFEYAMLDDQQKAFDWLAPITLRPVVGMNFPYFTPFIGMEIVNLGRWVPYGNLGLVPSVSVDVSGLPTGDWTSLANSRVGVGLVYQFVPPLVSTNLGLGATLSVPMNRLNSPMLSIDLIVYLSDDLFPL